MNKQEIIDIFKWRKTLIKNIDKITGATKKSKQSDLSSQGQLDLFSMGLEDCKSTPKLDEYEYPINIIECVNEETDTLGVPVLYNPLDEYDMHRELYCTHSVYQLFELTEAQDNIIVLDRITKIERKTSEAGNSYCKLYFSNLGNENYMYLFGKYYRDLISRVFIDEIYLIQLQYRTATKDFSKDSFVINYLKNVKDVEIEEEYNRLIKESKLVEMDKEWMLKNRKS